MARGHSPAPGHRCTPPSASGHAPLRAWPLFLCPWPARTACCAEFGGRNSEGGVEKGGPPGRSTRRGAGDQEARGVAAPSVPESRQGSPGPAIGIGPERETQPSASLQTRSRDKRPSPQNPPFFSPKSFCSIAQGAIVPRTPSHFKAEASCPGSGVSIVLIIFIQIPLHFGLEHRHLPAKAFFKLVHRHRHDLHMGQFSRRQVALHQELQLCA